MSWLLIVILIILILSVGQGIRKGLIRTIVSTFFLIFVMAISIWLTPYIEDLLKTHTSFPAYIEERCESFVQSELGGVMGESSGEGQAASAEGEQSAVQSGMEKEQIDKLPIPSYLKEKLMDNNTGEMYQSLVVDSFAEYLTKYLSGIVLYIAAFMISFVAAVILIQIIMKAVDVVTELPLIGLANRLGGGAAGVVRALLWVWVFFAVLTIFGSTSWGKICMSEINNDMILSYLYRHNLLMELILNLFGK